MGPRELNNVSTKNKDIIFDNTFDKFFNKYNKTLDQESQVNFENTESDNRSKASKMTSRNFNKLNKSMKSTVTNSITPQITSLINT